MSSEWLTTDRPDVVACMGSVPACAAWGCQARKLNARFRALTDYVQHMAICAIGMHDYGASCTCGLADLLTPASTEEPKKP